VAPRAVYDAVVASANAAAARPRAAGFTAPLYVSVQVEVAWGRPSGAFVGIDADRQDFPFATALGLSTYPFLGGFAEPEQVPSDYFSRVNAARLPLLVVEGGWTSAGAFGSTPDRQARWIRRQFELAEQAQARHVFQLLFTDLDEAAFGQARLSALALRDDRPRLDRARGQALARGVGHGFRPTAALKDYHRASRAFGTSRGDGDGERNSHDHSQGRQAREEGDSAGQQGAREAGGRRYVPGERRRHPAVEAARQGGRQGGGSRGIQAPDPVRVSPGASLARQGKQLETSGTLISGKVTTDSRPGRYRYAVELVNPAGSSEPVTELVCHWNTEGQISGMGGGERSGG
jgi:hypothetical protein